MSRYKTPTTVVETGTAIFHTKENRKRTLEEFVESLQKEYVKTKFIPATVDAIQRELTQFILHDDNYYDLEFPIVVSIELGNGHSHRFEFHLDSSGIGTVNRFATKLSWKTTANS